ALISSPPSLGRPFFTTQDVPPERVAALRSAFDATMKDEGFLTEARQLGLDMQPMQADVVTQIVFATVNAPADIVAKAKLAIEPQQAPPARKSTMRSSPRRRGPRATRCTLPFVALGPRFRGDERVISRAQQLALRRRRNCQPA